MFGYDMRFTAMIKAISTSVKTNAFWLIRLTEKTDYPTAAQPTSGSFGSICEIAFVAFRFARELLVFLFYYCGINLFLLYFVEVRLHAISTSPQGEHL